jgi:probable HAF family extracellular repeat protein
MKRSALVLTLALMFGVAIAGRPQAPQYSIVDLGLLPGGNFAEALNVNDHGQIVGRGSTATGATHAILWNNGEAIDLGTLGGASSSAWGINNRGQIVGESETTTGDFHAFLWQQGEMFDLADAGDFNRAFAINHRAEIVGHFQANALLWRRGMLTELGIVAAVDINDRGVIAGSDNASGEFHAVLWKRGVVTDLGTPPGATSSAARSINNHGQVVGESTVGAFLWDNGGMVALPGLIPGGFTFARDINNHGQIVGQSPSDPNVIGGAVHAVLWNDGDPIDLGTLPGDPLSSAAAINDHGLIVGFSGSGGLQARAVAWIPGR